MTDFYLSVKEYSNLLNCLEKRLEKHLNNRLKNGLSEDDAQELLFISNRVLFEGEKILSKNKFEELQKGIINLHHFIMYLVSLNTQKISFKSNIVGNSISINITIKLSI